MSINKKVLLLFISLFFILGFLFFTILKDIEKDSITSENALVYNKVSALRTLFKDRLNRLNSISYNYSYDSKILSKLNNKDASKQASYDIASQVNISYFILINSSKKIIYSQVYDVNFGEYLDLPEKIDTFIDSEKFDTYANDKDKLNFITLNYEKVIFTVEKIDNLGYLFIGRSLDSSFLSDMSLLLDSYVSLTPSYEFKKDNFYKEPFSYDIKREEKDFIYSNVEFKDEFDGSSFFLTLKIDRHFYNQIIQNNISLLALFLISFIILNLLVYVFINRIFIKRIEKISSTVKSISKNKELSSEVIELSYNDEITYLSKKMNEMFKVINNSQNEKIKKERDFLQSVLDSQQHIIFITDGTSIQSANKKFLDIFKSSNSFLDNIALLDNATKNNLLRIAKNHSSIDKPAKFELSDKDHKYFIFDISRVEVQKYIICMNDVSKFNERILQLKNKASIDELTSCFNKSTIIEYCKYWLEIKSFGLIVLDIDKFKGINDTYGHLIGDYILRDVASLVSKHLSSDDILGRFGGEEFILLIDDMQNNIENISNRIRKLIEEYVFVYDDLELTITASFGCTYSTSYCNYEQLFKRADEALYEAKNSGRNRVIYK